MYHEQDCVAFVLSFYVVASANHLEIHTCTSIFKMITHSLKSESEVPRFFFEIWHGRQILFWLCKQLQRWDNLSQPCTYLSFLLYERSPFCMNFYYDIKTVKYLYHPAFLCIYVAHGVSLLS